MRIFFEKANEVKHCYKRRSLIFSEEDGTLLIENVKIAAEFKKRFDALLNQLIGRTIIEECVLVEQNVEPLTIEVDLSELSKLI